MRVCQRTHQGLVRTSNQDSLIVDEGVYGVADGMGGHQAGEVASAMAAEVICASAQKAAGREISVKSAVSCPKRQQRAPTLSCLPPITPAERM